MAQSKQAQRLAGRAGPMSVKAPSKGRPSGNVPEMNFEIVDPVGTDCIMPNSAKYYANPAGQLANGRGSARTVTLPKE